MSKASRSSMLDGCLKSHRTTGCTHPQPQQVKSTQQHLQPQLCLKPNSSTLERPAWSNIMMVDITTEQAGARDVEAGWCGHRGQGQGLCNWQTGRFLEIQEYRAVHQKNTRKKIQEKCKYQVNGRANIQSFRSNRRCSSSKTGP